METGSREGSSRRNLAKPKAGAFPVPDAYEVALARAERRLKAWEVIYEQERGEAVGLVAELLSHSPEQRELIVRNCPRFHTWGVFERILQRSWEQMFSSPRQAELLATLALLLSDHLDLAYGAEAIEDLRARSWVYIGNSLRLRSDLATAEQAFRRSWGHLRQGTGDPVERAIFLDLAASLLRAQRRFDFAIRLLRRALKLALSVGDQHRAGRILISIDIVHHQAGTPEKGIPLLYRALDLIDPEAEPRLLLCVWHNLVDDLTEVGRFMEARKIFHRTRDLYRISPEWATHRRRWVAGKIAVGLGQYEEGEELLLEAHRGFLADEAAYDVALISLELSALYARQGRTTEIKQLAAAMVPIFSSREIHREAAAALAFWKQAVDAESAGIELAAQIIGFLKRARYDNDFPFIHPGGQVPASE